MLDAVYEETQGIIVLAVVLYVLIQEDAIRSERERFGVERGSDPVTEAFKELLPHFWR